MKITRFDWGRLARVLGAHGLEDAPQDLESVIGVIDLTPYLEPTEGGGGFVFSPLGKIRSIAVPDPAAGADFIQTVPVGVGWDLFSILGRLTTSAAVANRAVRIILDDGANSLVLIPDAISQLANVVMDYTWAHGINSRGSNLGLNERGIDLPAGAILGAGYRIRSVVGNIQAADQWTNVRLLVREWAAA